MEYKDENYIHVSYLIKEVEDKIEFTLINETFDDNPERMTHINQGWDMVVGKIKEIAERN